MSGGQTGNVANECTSLRHRSQGRPDSNASRLRNMNRRTKTPRRPCVLAAAPDVESKRTGDLR